MTIRVVYSNGTTSICTGWTPGMIDRLRASWAEIREPRSTATVEILSVEDQE